MAEVGLILSIGGLVTGAAGLSRWLYSVADGIGTAGREFSVFGREVSLFAAVWDQLKLALEQNQELVSADLWETLERIGGETKVILAELQTSVEKFSNKNKNERRNGRIAKYF